jgi:O-antigen/teichoic acid export membrane protein
MAGLVQFLTANILISQFFSPASVTPYQIAYRYVSLVMVVFSIICMPFWNATTDAYERQDMEWIRKANQKMNWMTLGIASLLIIMTIVSPLVYQLWIGGNCHIPFGMTVMMALYIFLVVLSMRYSYFLNGIGALRLQLYMTIMTIIFIPMAWVVSTTTHDIIWFMATMSFCITPSIIVNMIQFNKIIHNTDKGIWKV